MNKFIFIFIVFTFFMGCVNNKPDKEKLFIEARDKQQNGQIDSALVIYHDLLMLDSSYSKAYIGIGLILADKGDYRNAIENTKKAINIEPTGIAYFYLGGYYWGLNQFDSAKICMEKALIYQPNDHAAMNFLAEIYLRLKELDKALEISNKLISLDSNSPNGYFARGCTYGMMEMHDKEIEDFKKAIALDSLGETDALVNIAYTYHYAIKDNVKACEYLKLAIEKIKYKPTDQELKDFCGENL